MIRKKYYSCTNRRQPNIARLRPGKNVDMNNNDNTTNANDIVEVFEETFCCQGFCTRNCLIIVKLKVHVDS